MEGPAVNGIVVHFGGLLALNQGLEAPPGRIAGLIGPNGNGKTTSFNVCCGCQLARKGKVTFRRRLRHEGAPECRARLGIGRTSQRRELLTRSRSEKICSWPTSRSMSWPTP